MNKADVIQSVSEKTGIAPDVCERILDSLEKPAGDLLATKLKAGPISPTCSRRSQAKLACPRPTANGRCRRPPTS